jgi:hypothetical protein
VDEYDGVGEMLEAPQGLATDFIRPWTRRNLPKARAFAVQRLLAGPILSFLEAGHTLSQDRLVRIMMDSAPLFTDLDKR